MVQCAFLDSFDFSKETSIYIHVPFCLSKCAYCAFYSLSGCRQTEMDAYTDRLVNEILEVNRHMDGRPYCTAFIGGGNPGCLGQERLSRIADAVCENGRPAEFSTEMNPESLNGEFFPLFESHFTRLSMGVQSLDPKALEFLGRNSDLASTLRGLELSQKLHARYGTDLSYDLITCLGSWHDELSDVRKIVNEYPSDHLSVYALTLEENTPLYRRNPVLPDADGQYSILNGIWDYLESLGFEHYEVSNFARPGKRCAHNCRYWAYEQYIGLGPAAASTAFGKDGKVTRHVFRPSVKDYVDGYARGELFSGLESEALTDREAAEEQILMGLRYKGGLDLKRLSERTHKVIDSRIIAAIEGFEAKDGFLVPDDSGLMTADAAASLIVDEL